jgi:carboxylesterase type B
MWGPNFTFCDNAVCHAAELPFVFQPPALSAFGDNMTPQELVLSNLMGAFWTNFAAAGVPDPSWPPYNALSQMHFTLNSSIEHDFLGATCDFWDNVIGYKWV